MVWLTCILQCQSLHQMSTPSHLCLQPAALAPSAAQRRYHTRCTSTDYPLHQTQHKIKLSVTAHKIILAIYVMQLDSPLSLQRTNRNSAAPCFTAMSICVMRRTSLLRTVQPISGLSFTSVRGGNTCVLAKQDVTFI